MSGPEAADETFDGLLITRKGRKRQCLFSSRQSKSAQTLKGFARFKIPQDNQPPTSALASAASAVLK
jgi:hypothetical protein